MNETFHEVEKLTDDAGALIGSTPGAAAKRHDEARDALEIVLGFIIGRPRD